MAGEVWHWGLTCVRGRQKGVSVTTPGGIWHPLPVFPPKPPLIPRPPPLTPLFHLEWTLGRCPVNVCRTTSSTRRHRQRVGQCWASAADDGPALRWRLWSTGIFIFYMLYPAEFIPRILILLISVLWPTRYVIQMRITTLQTLDCNYEKYQLSEDKRRGLVIVEPLVTMKSDNPLTASHHYIRFFIMYFTR